MKITIDAKVQKCDKEEVLAIIESMRKRYNVPAENIVADAKTLKWLFLT